MLCYHIVETPAAPRMQITRDVFRQHLRYLEMTGYNVIPLRHLYEYVTGKRASIPKNAVVITIDDGWRSTYTEAYPELQKRKFPFTVFIYPKIIGQTSNALTWQQIREMSDAGVDIQSHSLSHPFLTRRRHRSLDEAGYTRWLQKELAESRRILEKETGKKVQFIAYPYGDYDDRVAENAAKAGYTAALTCDFGRVKRGSDPLRMKRFVIDDRMDFAAFRRYLGAAPLQLADVTPKPGDVDPGVTVISAKIPKHESLDPKSVGMALLSVGNAVPYSYDARSGAISLVLKDALSTLKSKYH
ncbi:MAG TPA: polysaccharide deacetylase family protein, partial [Thermoanaerobaculia bacterium]|nr:polysaccharide deacetylase family protein [Thermoanaerobaculia bacterium]